MARLHDGPKNNAVVSVPPRREREDILSLFPICHKAATGCDFDTNNDTASGDSYVGTTCDLKEAFARFLLSDLIRFGREGDHPYKFVNEDDVQDLWKLMTGRQDKVDIETQSAVCYSILYHKMLVTETGLIGEVCLDARVGDQFWSFVVEQFRL
jgi:hypothetical protein